MKSMRKKNFFILTRVKEGEEKISIGDATPNTYRNETYKIWN